jgi:hypothetical protein
VFRSLGCDVPMTPAPSPMPNDMGEGRGTSTGENIKWITRRRVGQLLQGALAAACERRDVGTEYLQAVCRRARRIFAGLANAITRLAWLLQWEWDWAVDKDFLDVAQPSFDCSENPYHAFREVTLPDSYLGGSVAHDGSRDDPAPKGRSTGMLSRIETPHAVTCNIF